MHDCQNGCMHECQNGCHAHSITQWSERNLVPLLNSLVLTHFNVQLSIATPEKQKIHFLQNGIENLENAENNL